MIQPITEGKRSLGVTFSSSGQADVLVWAPKPNHVALKLTDTSETIPLQADELGYWHLTTPQLKPGSRYVFVLDDKNECQDPASLAQPEGIQGPSQAVDTAAFPWEDQHWANPALESYLIYELHVGTFTPEGTFAALEHRLDYLKALGVNAIEIMPVAQFSNARNWGYDGVFMYATQNTYGGARALQSLVNACHQKGIAVVLDVVYNHFGPDCNCLTDYGPYLTGKYCTPWGDAVNFDDAWGDGVRRHVIENALMWLRDFHIDALRLDAVHAIKDCSPVHILQEIREHVDRLMQATDRQHYLLVECDLNDPRYINPIAEGGYGMDAQWMDEFHHALRVTVGEEKTGYYADFEGINHLAKAYRDAYVYDGQFSTVRHKFFGRKADNNPGHQFIVFSQNHDQIGNRMLGERSSQLFSPTIVKVMAGAVLVSPYIPLLFMGEEWGESAPFLYFVSHSDPKLIEAVRQGRKEEFSSSDSDDDVPDPEKKETFQEAKLNWNSLTQEPHRTLLRYYQTLIALRQQLPALSTLNRQQMDITENEDRQTLMIHRWHGDQHVLCLMNFSSEPQPIGLSAQGIHWRKLLDSTYWREDGYQVVDSTPESVAGESTLTLPPESFILYSCGHENLAYTLPEPIMESVYLV
ncbi:malto-oligosyltrehalose trehalohydrolase [Spirosoma koreense]